MWQRNTRGGIAEVLLCAVLVVSVGIDVARTTWSPPTLQDPFLTRPLLQSAIAAQAPVVVASSLEYLTYWYYAPPVQRSRLQYLADADSARRYMGFDTIDLGYMALSRWTALPVLDFREYVARHPEFRAYSSGSGWLLSGVTDIGGTIDEIHTVQAERLVLVRMKPEPNTR